MAIESFQIAMIFASFCSVFLLKVYSLISFKKLWDIPLSNSEEELFYEETYETIFFFILSWPKSSSNESFPRKFCDGSAPADLFLYKRPKNKIENWEWYTYLCRMKLNTPHHRALQTFALRQRRLLALSSCSLHWSCFQFSQAVTIFDL